jgi:hypothetical protein
MKSRMREAIPQIPQYTFMVWCSVEAQGELLPSRFYLLMHSETYELLFRLLRRESVSIVACCNAEGTYVPLSVMTKGVRQNVTFSDGLMPSSKVFINSRVHPKVSGLAAWNENCKW